MASSKGTLRLHKLTIATDAQFVDCLTMAASMNEVVFEECSFNNPFDPTVFDLPDCSLKSLAVVKCSLSTEQSTKLVTNYILGHDSLSESLKTIEVPEFDGPASLLFKKRVGVIFDKTEQVS